MGEEHIGRDGRNVGVHVAYRPKLGYIVFVLVFTVFDAVMAGMHLQAGDWKFAAFFAVFTVFMAVMLVMWVRLCRVWVMEGSASAGDIGMKKESKEVDIKHEKDGEVI